MKVDAITDSGLVRKQNEDDVKTGTLARRCLGGGL